MGLEAVAKPRSVVRVWHGGKLRPGVVLQVNESSLLIVLTGSSVRRDHIEAVTVEPQTRYGKALGLTATTCFNGYCIVAAADVGKVCGVCPPGLFLELREFFEQGLAPRLSQ